MRNIYLVIAILFCKITIAQTPESLLQNVQEKYTAEKIYYTTTNHTI
jgi:hypothetical protein